MAFTISYNNLFWFGLGTACTITFSQIHTTSRIYSRTIYYPLVVDDSPNRNNIVPVTMMTTEMDHKMKDMDGTIRTESQSSLMWEDVKEEEFDNHVEFLSSFTNDRKELYKYHPAEPRDADDATTNNNNNDHSKEANSDIVENSTSNYTDTIISSADPGLLIPSNTDPGLLIPSEEPLEVESSDSRTRIRISRPRKGPGAR